MTGTTNHLPDSGTIREFLTATFSDEELTTLCFDYFRPVYENFSTGMSKGQKIQLLFDHCTRREHISALLARLAEVRPQQYNKRFGGDMIRAGSDAHTTKPATADPLSINLRNSVVAVLDFRKRVVGTGFVVGAHLVLTCAHVIEAAGGGPGGTINVRYQFNGE